MMATPIHNSDLFDGLSPESLKKKDPTAYNELQILLATMLQDLLTTMTKSIQLLLEQQKNNAIVANLGIAVANSGVQKAKEAETTLEEQEYEIRHPPWWKFLISYAAFVLCPPLGVIVLAELIVQPMLALELANKGELSPGLEVANILLKYVLPMVMIVITGFSFGIVAAGVALALFILTSISLNNGKSLLESGEDAITHAIAVKCGLNEDQEKIFSACFKIAIAVVIIIGCIMIGDAAAGEGCVAEEGIGVEAENGANLGIEADFAASSETATTTETTEAEAAATKLKEDKLQYKKIIRRICGFNAASSTLVNNSAIEDLIYGSIRCNNPNTTKEKAKEISQKIATGLNIFLSFALILGATVSLKIAGQSSEVISLFNKGNTKALPQIMKALSLATFVAGTANAVNSLEMGIQALRLAKFRAILTRLESLLTWSAGIQQQIDSADQMLAAAQKSVQNTYSTTLANPQNAKPLFTEASAIQNGQRA